MLERVEPVLVADEELQRRERSAIMPIAMRTMVRPCSWRPARR